MKTYKDKDFTPEFLAMIDQAKDMPLLLTARSKTMRKKLSYIEKINWVFEHSDDEIEYWEDAERFYLNMLESGQNRFPNNTEDDIWLYIKSYMKLPKKKQTSIDNYFANAM